MAYKTMTLSECAKFDEMNLASSKLTGWGKICIARAEMRKNGQLPTKSKNYKKGGKK